MGSITKTAVLTYLREGALINTLKIKLCNLQQNCFSLSKKNDDFWGYSFWTFCLNLWNILKNICRRIPKSTPFGQISSGNQLYFDRCQIPNFDKFRQFSTFFGVVLFGKFKECFKFVQNFQFCFIKILYKKRGAM